MAISSPYPLAGDGRDGRWLQRLAKAACNSAGGVSTVATSAGVGVESSISGEGEATPASPHSIPRRTSFGDKPESSADSSSNATANAGVQLNSARFAAAEYKSRCRLPWSSTLRMKSSVARFKVGVPLPMARRAAFASLSFATCMTAVCQSAAAWSLCRVGVGRSNAAGSLARSRILSSGNPFIGPSG